MSNNRPNKSFLLSLSEKWLVALTIAFIGLVYFIYLPVTFDFDGTVFSSYLRYALVKGDMSGLYQPQHPLYFPLNYGIYKFFGAALGYRVLEYFHLQLFSLVFGILTLWISYKILAALLPEASPRRWILPAGTAMLAATYGIWYYSVEAEVHIPGLFFVAAGIYLMFFKKGEADSIARQLAAAACLTAAAGFHLTNGLIAFSVLGVFLVRKKSFGIIFRFFSFYAGFWIVGLAMLAWGSGMDLLNHFKNQLMGSDPMAGYRIDYWSGGFSLKAFWESLKSVAHGLIYPASSTVSLMALVLMLGMMILIWWAKRRGGMSEFFVLVFWGIPYFIFFSFWDHRNVEFKLNVLLPLLLLFILAVSRIKRRWIPVALALVLVVLTVSSYYLFVRPGNDPENNSHYQVSQAILNRTPRNAVIVIAGCGSPLSIHNKIYISYFAYRRTLILDWMLGRGMSLEQAAERIRREQSGGAPVYFFSETLKEGPVLRQLLNNHQLDKTAYFEFLRVFQHSKRISLTDGHYLMPAVFPAH